MEATEIDKALEEIETKAEQLRALYEQYFMGLERLEPLVMRKDVDRRIKLLRREQLRNTAQRFKFNTLVQRFNTMQSHWARVVREIENGTYRRDVIRAAARFGEGALAVLGKKKTKDLMAAVAKAQGQRPHEDGGSPRAALQETFELEPDDLIEEEDDDDVPTPPKLEVPAAAAQAWAYSSGLGQGDLPLVGYPSDHAPTPAHHGGAVAGFSAHAGPLPQPATPKRSAGLRWGAGAASDPASAIRPAAGDVQRRVAELASELGVPHDRAAGEGARPRHQSFGELDLAFDDSSSGRPPAAAVSGASTTGPRVGLGKAGPLPVVTATPLMGAQPAVTAPMARSGGPQAPAPTAPAESTGGFGVLDIALDGDSPAAPAQPALPEPSPSSPGSGIRQGASRPVRAPAATPAHPAAAAELPDQRIRQIYAKYVETKRSTHESTAGVTFEKLAASLRAQADKLKSAHPTRSIDYEVVVKDGKTHLKPVRR